MLDIKNYILYPMSIHRSSIFRWAVGLCLLIYLLTLVDYQEFSRVLSRAHLSFILLAITIVLIDRIWMGAKWMILLRAQSIRASFLSCIRSYFMASLLGLVLPTSVGSDVMRLMSFSVREGEREKIAASIVVEKVLGLFAMLLLVCICSFLLIQNFSEIYWKYFYFILFFLITVSVFFVGSLYYLPRSKSDRFKGKFFKKLGNVVSSYQQFRYYPKAMLAFFILSFFEQFVPFISTFVLARAFELPGSALNYFMVIPFIYFIARIPISVDAIGILEGLYVLLFPLVGLSKTDALLLALASRVTTTIGNLIGGVFYFLGREKETFSKIS